MAVIVIRAAYRFKSLNNLRSLLSYKTVNPIPTADKMVAWHLALMLPAFVVGSQISKRQVTDPTPDQAEIDFANLVCTVYAVGDITCPNNL
jgi:hypothetical protein